MVRTDAASFGDELRRLRQRAGLSQEELAEGAGLSPAAVSALERGHRLYPYPQTIRALTDALQLSEGDARALRASAPQRPSGRPASPSDETAFSLPARMTNLVGRQRELAELRQLLVDDAARLVTLTGPGGVGKTRLAVELADQLRVQFPGGVAFVSLAAVQDPALVLPMIAGTLGVRHAGGGALAERLGQFLHDRPLLLVLDNFEHLTEAVLPVAELMATHKDLAVLATSRESLRLRIEREYPVGPLALPASGPAVSLDDMAGNAAVALFVQRARAVVPDFALTGSNAGAVAEICRRLDGLPLAIELAAARIKLFPAEALLSRLQNRLNLLTGGPRDQAARLQSMRAAIAWSHDLLSPEEQILFRRLAVFVGGFTLEAAEAVSGQETEDRSQEPGAGRQSSVSSNQPPATSNQFLAPVLDGVASLVDKSLLYRLETVESELRFSMLETIREFGLERLAASGEELAMRVAHAAWATDVAARSGLGLGVPLRASAMEAGAEIANYRAALNWLADSGRTREFLRLAGTTVWTWYLTGQLREGRDWAERALAAAPDDPSADRASAAYAAGHLAHYLGDDAAAVSRLEQAGAVARTAGESSIESYSDLLLGIIAEDAGDYAHARRLLESARAKQSEVGHTRFVALANYHLGIVAFGEGDSSRAIPLLEAAAAKSRAEGDSLIEAWCLEWLALLGATTGDVARAERALRSRLTIGSGARSIPREGQFIAAVAVVGAETGADAEAARLMGVLDARLQESGGSSHLPERSVYEAAAERLRLKLGPDRYDALLTEGRSLSDGALEADILAIVETASTRAADPADTARETST